MRKLALTWDLLIAATAAALVFAAAYANLLTLERQKALLKTSRHNSVFEVSQAPVELARFEAELGRYAIAPTADAAEQVKVRFEVLRNRLGVLQGGEVGLLIDDEPQARQILVRLDAAVTAAAPLVNAVESPGAPRAILDLLAPVDAPTATMAALANQTVGEVMGEERDLLMGVYWKGLSLTLSLIVCGAALVLTLVYRNRSVRQIAHRDHLTGLPNRLVFRTRLAALASEPPEPNRLVVMLLDVDMFKHVNDAFGHAAGDLLLSLLARRLQKLLKESLLVSRLGGDEFAILLSAADSRAEAARIAEAICAALARPFDLDGKEVLTGVSIGIVEAAPGISDPEALFRSADMALYAAKAAGRNTYRFFDPQMERDLRTRREMQADLHAALLSNRLELQFQPIVDLETRAIVSCEALVRWAHPTHGLVSPAHFIPLAEETGLIGPLGEWVIREACAAARSWPEDIRVSINLSARQFDSADLVGTVREALAASGLDARRVELEITESVLLRDSDHVLQILTGLRELGTRIALDDFGTGYSSLGYLMRFPIDKIKIDQSFAREITTKLNSALIMESICSLATKLGLTTTAEGIETEAHATMIRAMGYAEGQGFYFDRPLRAAECLERLRVQATTRRHAA